MSILHHLGIIYDEFLLIPYYYLCPNFSSLSIVLLFYYCFVCFFTDISALLDNKSSSEW